MNFRDENVPNPSILLFNSPFPEERMKKSLLILAGLALASALSLGLKNPPEPGRTFAYPSPSSCGWVNLAYVMRQDGTCRVRIFHEGGDLVASFLENRTAGVQESRVNVCPFAPGIYLYRLKLSYNGAGSEELRGRFVVKR